MRAYLFALRLLPLLLLLAGIFMTPAFADDDDEDRYLVDQVVVKLDLASGVTIEEINAEYGTTTLDIALASRGIYLLQTLEDSEDVADTLDDDIRILYAEANYIGDVPEANPRGSYAWGGQDSAPLEGQYARALIDLSPAQQVALGNGVTVAIIDTGVQLDHPQLNAILVAGYDFIDDDNDPTDIALNIDSDGDTRLDEAYGHGTHVAGIVNLVAPAAQIMPLRVLDSDGTGNNFFVAEAISYAVENGADVISLSLGSTYDAYAVKEVVDEAEAAGVVVVAAAGNSASEDRQYPAALSHVLAVTSVNAQRRKATSANYGAWVDIAAPGEGIYSSYPTDGYAWWSGTSMATPFVSGLAALVLSADGNRRSEDVINAIMTHATSLDALNPNYEGKLGAGLIDADNTVLSILPPSSIVLDRQQAQGATDTSWLPALLAGLALISAVVWRRRRLARQVAAG